MDFNKTDIIKSLIKLEFCFNSNIDCDKKNVNLCHFTHLFRETIYKTKLYLEKNDTITNDNKNKNNITNIDYKQLSTLNKK
jgi:hypothetical protein